MGDVSEATRAVEVNLSGATKDNFIAAVLEVARLPLTRFAHHPRLRNVCLAKIIVLRSHRMADEDVLDALELLRVVLWQSLDVDSWKKDERDEDFRISVSCHTLVYGHSEVEFDAEEVIAEYDDD